MHLSDQDLSQLDEETLLNLPEAHAANTRDTIAAAYVFERTTEKYPTIEAYSGDASYRGTAVTYVDQTLNLTLHISKKIKDTWAVLPKHRVVERTFF